MRIAMMTTTKFKVHRKNLPRHELGMYCMDRYSSISRCMRRRVIEAESATEKGRNQLLDVRPRLAKLNVQTYSNPNGEDVEDTEMGFKATASPRTARRQFNGERVKDDQRLTKRSKNPSPEEVPPNQRTRRKGERYDTASLAKPNQQSETDSNNLEIEGEVDFDALARGDVTSKDGISKKQRDKFVTKRRISKLLESSEEVNFDDEEFMERVEPPQRRMSSLNIDSVTGTSTSTDDPDLHMNEIGNNQEISL
eukprot:m.327589 g.327589  ORF g.327589 m.327589 type:complete len:252 (-) comp16565_c0_seq61:1009-1764(-)